MLFRILSLCTVVIASRVEREICNVTSLIVYVTDHPCHGARRALACSAAIETMRLAPILLLGLLTVMSCQ